MPRHWLSLLTLITLTLVFVLLWESPPEQFLRPPTEVKVALPPSVYLSDVEVTQYNRQGKVNYRFNATKLKHFQQNPKQQSPQDYTDIDSPYLAFYEKINQPWYAEAKQGRASQLSDSLVLTKDVRLWREVNGTPATELTTTELTLHPEKQFAETDKPVMITAPEGHTRAVGMKANLKQNRIELLSRVRGVHEPNQRKP